MNRKRDPKIKQPAKNRTASQIQIHYKNASKSEQIVFALPDGARDLQVAYEKGVSTRRTQGFGRVASAWRSSAGRLVRKVFFLPASAEDVTVRYTYVEEACAVGEPGVPGAPGAVPAERWDVAAIAAPFRVDMDEAVASQVDGLRLLDLGPLLKERNQKLGEGVFSEVYAVTCPGLPRMCVKKYRKGCQHRFKEAQLLAQVSHLPNLPRLVGVCPQPPAILMTCHGDMSLQTWVENFYDRRQFL